ncbi:hypothetical protein WISP_62040 [Willisornis vidua]|uniref:Uncharacterized protein n=1 Tax=Willisornis vidua TaxID=1566151 RepID=A0ABQ9DD55_9PASS|nr:hypothetical protein WISP_62040 [Willisornis vidua]
MAIPIVDSRSSLRPLGTVASSKRLCLSKGSATQEPLCNRTQELKESGESKEQLVAVGTVLGAGKTDQTWEYVESFLSSKLAPVLPSGCEDAVPAERSAGHQLSLELEHVKKELERVKGELVGWMLLIIIIIMTRLRERRFGKGTTHGCCKLLVAKKADTG